MSLCDNRGTVTEWSKETKELASDLIAWSASLERRGARQTFEAFQLSRREEEVEARKVENVA